MPVTDKGMLLKKLVAVQECDATKAEKRTIVGNPKLAAFAVSPKL